MNKTPDDGNILADLQVEDQAIMDKLNQSDIALEKKDKTNMELDQQIQVLREEIHNWESSSANQ